MGFAHLPLQPTSGMVRQDPTARARTVPSPEHDLANLTLSDPDRHRVATPPSTVPAAITQSPEMRRAAPRLSQMELRGQGDLANASSQADVSRIHDLASQFITHAQPHLAGTVSVHVEVFQQTEPSQETTSNALAPNFDASSIPSLHLPQPLAFMHNEQSNTTSTGMSIPRGGGFNLRDEASEMPTLYQGTSSPNTNPEPITVHDSANDASEVPWTTDHHQRSVVFTASPELPGQSDGHWNEFDLAFMDDDMFNLKRRGFTTSLGDD